MGIISGGGGGGPAAGSYVPVADKTGVTVNTTTYDNNITSSGKMTTLVFPQDTASVAMAVAGDAFPRVVMQVGDAAMWMSDGTYDPLAGGAICAYHDANVGQHVVGVDRFLHVRSMNILTGDDPNSSSFGGNAGDVCFTTANVSLPCMWRCTTAGTGGVAVWTPVASPGSPVAIITSGALGTVQLVTATGAQIVTSRDVETITPCTFNPGAATTATVTVALSPDNVTYSTLAVETQPVGVVFDGTIRSIRVRVPAGWYLKLTANAQATLGLTTYY